MNQASILEPALFKQIMSNTQSILPLNLNAQGKPLSVLVVESDPDLQWKLARTLTVYGNRVVGTSTEEGALTLMAEWSVDMVVIDEELKGASGIDLSKKIYEQFPNIPVVLISNQDDEILFQEAQPWISKWVKKPLIIEDLVGAIRNVRASIIPPMPLPQEIQPQ